MESSNHTNRRASTRLTWSLPVLLDWERTVYSAVTENLSAEGARIKAPVTFTPGTKLALTNLQTGERTRFRVVWGAPERGSDDCFRLGIQMLDPMDGFWGFEWSRAPRPLPGRPAGGAANQTLRWRNEG